MSPVLRRLAPSFLPPTAVLELTYRCNHACPFCSCPWEAEGGGYAAFPELDLPAWKRTVETLCRMGVRDLAFTGGEPLLKEGLADLLTFAAACTVEHIETQEGGLVSRFGPPSLHLLSNGSAMSDEILALCQAHDIQLSLSLPGLSTFPEHTGGARPEKVLHGLREAARLGLRTTAGVTVTRQNLHELAETLCEALLAGASSVLLNRFLPGGRGLAHAADLALDVGQVREMLVTADEVLSAADRPGNVGTELPACVLEGLHLNRLTVGTRCAAGIEFFAVDPSGWVRVCNHSPTRLHRIDEIERVRDHPYWRRFVHKRFLPIACGPCPTAVACDGGCREAAHVTRGAVDAADPLLPGLGLG